MWKFWHYASECTPITDVPNINFAEQKNTLKIGQMMRAVPVF